jgi:hypothetical protein
MMDMNTSLPAPTRVSEKLHQVGEFFLEALCRRKQRLDFLRKDHALNHLFTKLPLLTATLLVRITAILILSSARFQHTAFQKRRS